MEDLRAGVVVLDAEQQQATVDLAQAQARHKQQEQQHWLTVVLPQLHDAFDQYCCRLLDHRAGLPPTTPAAVLQRLGPLGASQLRIATCQRLRARYPFSEEGAEHALSGVL